MTSEATARRRRLPFTMLALGGLLLFVVVGNDLVFGHARHDIANLFGSIYTGASAVMADLGRWLGIGTAAPHSVSAAAAEPSMRGLIVALVWLVACTAAVVFVVVCAIRDREHRGWRRFGFAVRALGGALLLVTGGVLFVVWSIAQSVPHLTVLFPESWHALGWIAQAVVGQ